MYLTITLIQFIKISSASLNALNTVSFKLFKSFTNKKLSLHKDVQIYIWLAVEKTKTFIRTLNLEYEGSCIGFNNILKFYEKS